GPAGTGPDDRHAPARLLDVLPRAALHAEAARVSGATPLRGRARNGVLRLHRRRDVPEPAIQRDAVALRRHQHRAAVHLREGRPGRRTGEGPSGIRRGWGRARAARVEGLMSSSIESAARVNASAAPTPAPSSRTDIDAAERPLVSFVIPVRNDAE